MLDSAVRWVVPGGDGVTLNRPVLSERMIEWSIE